VAEPSERFRSRPAQERRNFEGGAAGSITLARAHLHRPGCKTAPVPGIHTTIDPVLLGDERIGSVATITIDNPDRRNAMTAAMYQAMPDACAVALAESDLRVVVLRGAGDLAFSAGSDITEFKDRRMGGEAQGYDRAEHAAWDAIESIPVPVIAAIRGSCRGGGVAIALQADLRIAADDATFSVPPANLGLSYPQKATRRLVATVGPSQAKRLLFTAEAIDAPRAERIGLVDEVVPAADHTDHVAAMVDAIAHRAPLTHRASKRVVDAVIAHGTAVGISLSELSPEAAEAAAACSSSDDFREGVRSFAEKRPPRFRGA